MHQLAHLAMSYTPPWEQESIEDRLSTIRGSSRSIVWIYETPDTSTFRYRVYNMVESLRNQLDGSIAASWFTVAEIASLVPHLGKVSAVVLARVRYDEEVGRLLSTAKSLGVKLLFDCDDLVFDSRYIHLLLHSLDQKTNASDAWDFWHAYVGRLEATARLCDAGITTNSFLAQKMEDVVPGSVSVVPNFMNRRQQEFCDRLLDAKRKSGFRPSKPLMIGYFSGTPSHSKDWAVAAPALGRMLAKEPSIRLRVVGFHDFLSDFPISRERLETVPLQDWLNLQRYIAEADINVAPLNDNVFTNCKSELKFFEAAAVGTWTVASPTHAFSQVITSPRIGHLSPPENWEEALELALSLVSDPRRYAEIAEENAELVCHRYGWNRFTDCILRACLGNDTDFRLEPHSKPTASTPSERPPAHDVPAWKIVVKRNGESLITLPASQFETFAFKDGDTFTILPQQQSESLPVSWGDRIVPLAPGHSIRIPPSWEWFHYQGLQVPKHLVDLTGAGPETFESIGDAHMRNYAGKIGLFEGMTFLDVGCGIGRDAFAIRKLLGKNGAYIGIDVTRDSVAWCNANISKMDSRFTFHHFDAHHELYNPFGTLSTCDFTLPVADIYVDRIGLASVFTHLFEEEVLHYLQEFRRVLRHGGRIHASFFLHSPEALAAAQTRGKTPWQATFSHELSPGVFANSEEFPRGAVAFTDEKIRALVEAAGLRMMRPYVRGAWSGLHGDNAEEGQDALVLGLKCDCAECLAEARGLTA